MSDWLKVFSNISEQNTFRDGANYVEPHVSCTSDGKNLKYNKSKNYIYIDQNEMDPSERITGDIGGPIVQAIRNKSHIYLGSYSNGKLEVTQMSDSNKVQFSDGTSASNCNGNLFMKLPEFWWSCEETETNSDIWRCGLSLRKVQGWSHWDGKYFIGVHEAKASQQNDTNNAISSNNALKDYTATLSDEIGYTGCSSGNIPQDVFRQMARNLGNGHTITTWNVHCIMALLFYFYYGTTDSQGTCGSGSNSYNRATGVCDSMGMTDTTTSTGTTSINFWGLENWWGDKFEWIDNIYCFHDENYINHVLIYNEDDTTYREVILDQRTSEQIEAYDDCEDSLESYHNAVLGSNFDLLPTPKGAYIEDDTIVTGNTNEGYCDQLYIGCIVSNQDSTITVTDKDGVVHTCSHPGCVGGRSYGGSGSNGGVAYIYLSNDPVIADAFGARLQYHGNYVELTNSEYKTKYLFYLI